MMWQIKDKEYIVKTRFAIFPKRIGEYWVWLQNYYVNYDWVNNGQGGCYIPHYYTSKKVCEYNIKQKINADTYIGDDVI